MTSEYDELLVRLEALVNPTTPQDSISTATAVETIDGAAAAIRALTAQVVERDAVIEQAPHEHICWIHNHRPIARYCTCWKRQSTPEALAARDAVRDKTVRATALRDFAMAEASWLDPEFVALMEARADQEER